MIAFINSVVAGAAVTLLAGHWLTGGQTHFALLLGVAAALLIAAACLAFQRWRYRVSAPDDAARPKRQQ
jgi:hypothetical protein